MRSLAEGGVTPSAGLIATARQKISIGLHIMIRPRAGDFYYSADEFDVMRRDVLMAKQLGAEGVVFGILDRKRISTFREHAPWSIWRGRLRRPITGLSICPPICSGRWSR